MDRQPHLQSVAGDVSGKGVIIPLSLSGVEGQGVLQLRTVHAVGQRLIAVHSAHIFQDRAELHLGVDLGIGGLHGACGKALDGVDAHIGPHQGEGFFDHAVHGGGAPVDVFVELFLLLGGPAVAVRQFIHKVASLRQLCPCGLNFRHVHSVAGGPLDLLKGGQRGVQGGGDLFEHGAHAVIEGHLGLDSCHCLTTFFKRFRCV